MQLLKSFLFGVSYVSLFSGSFASVTSSQCSTLASSMADEAQESGQKCSQGNYMAGTSSVAFITTPDQASAKKLAHNLVSNKLAACVNIIPQITSIYEWEGKVNEDSEFLMMIKTRTSRVDELTKYVRENHPYSVAEVISLPIENGNPPYLDWITKTVPEKSKK